MKKVLFNLIYYLGAFLFIVLGIGLSYLIAYKLIYTSSLNEKSQRWLFMITIGLIGMAFLGIWNFIASIIKYHLLGDD